MISSDVPGDLTVGKNFAALSGLSKLLATPLNGIYNHDRYAVIAGLHLALNSCP